MRLPAFTYANVMSTIAAVIALTTGAAYAKATIGSAQVKNGSLTGTDIKDGSLKGVDLASGAITTAKLATSAVTSADIKDGTVTGTDIAANTVHKENIFLLDRTHMENDVLFTSSSTGPITTMTSKTVDVQCNAGKAINGSWDNDDGDPMLVLTASHAGATSDTWHFEFYNGGGGDRTASLYVSCIQ